jgi:hypothetical protein
VAGPILESVIPHIPTHAERLTVEGETYWVWATKLGFSLFKWPYQVDLENTEREGQPWHTIDWVLFFTLGGGLAECKPGHLDKEAFVHEAEKICEALKVEAHQRGWSPPFP